MKVRAAIAYGQHGQVSVETVELAPPGPRDVLIQMKAAGICHSDMSFINGERSGVEYPIVLGHEGAGVVLECGREVTGVKPGDHVIPVGVPECGACPACLSLKTNLCDEYFQAWPERPFRFDGRSAKGFCELGTFAEAIVVRETRVAKIRPDAPLDVVCCLGCAGATGLGAALYTARVEPGSSVVVFGLGGIGLNVVEGARLAGARQIIGVDTNPAKESLVRRAGAQHFVNPHGVDDLLGHLRELTGGGADYSFECVGQPRTLRDAVECTRPGWGTTVMIGVLPGAQEIALRPRALLEGRRLLGSYLGNTKTRTQLPGLVDLFMEGRISLDSLISHRIGLERINDGFAWLASGAATRTVIGF
ncbi:zinc-binding dehydrogenase [Pseudomonas sp. RIT-PI-AD]|uniref:zinc-binding dehydrogenase n=1 Tax=Pseudomonas sp. RIT-PI-AD TaxID=3035294 RepID=UPI0021DAEC3E|nr:zinc-binding dehydrogenase [Pseudomonas sp. RIT-PI-AD]